MIRAAALNNSPNADPIGRGCKVGQEEIAGLVVAVEQYSVRDHAADRRRWQGIVDGWERALAPVEGLTLRQVGPENAGSVPYLSIDWNERKMGFGREPFLGGLRGGSPRVEVWPTQTRGICITPFMLAHVRQIRNSCGLLLPRATVNALGPEPPTARTSLDS